MGALIIYGCIPSHKTSDPETEIEQPEIAYLYHGRWIDNKGHQIEIDLPTIANMQESMRKSILDTIHNNISKTEITYMEELSKVKFSLQQQLLIENGSLAILLNESPIEIKQQFEWRRRAMADAINSLDTNNDAIINDNIESVFKKFDVWNRVVKVPVDNSYIQTCRDNKVPIPPPWPSNQWKRQSKKINNITIDILDFEFLQEPLDTAVFVYKVPGTQGSPGVPGVCIALPRFKSSTKVIYNLGVICQSERTGSACFWDNTRILSPSSSQSIKGTMPGTNPSTDLKLTLEQMANGNTLVENCSSCHRGKNAFLIHPGTLLDLPSNEYDMDPRYWYTPVSNQKLPDGTAKWKNPKPSLTPPSFRDGESSCNACHTIPELTDSYCTAVLSNAIRKTMPSSPKDPNLDRWNVHRGPYARHTRMLKAACLIKACGPAPSKGKYDVCAGIRDK